MKKIINLVFILAVPLIFITFTLALAANIPALYEYGFNKYHISQSTSLSIQDLEHIARAMPAYFNSNEEEINLIIGGKELFNEREKIHMVDVKGLVRLDYLVLLILASFIAAYILSVAFISKNRLRWKSYFARLIWSSAITLGLILALALTLVFNFEGFFLMFHLVSFTNLFWMLDPSKDYLIRLFPSGFFFDAALFITILIAVEAIIVLLASIYARGKYLKREVIKILEK